MKEYLDAAKLIRARLRGGQPRIALMLGSGLSEIAGQLTDPLSIPDRDLPGFPLPTVPGHSGRLLIGDLNGVVVACLQGRAHYYEGHPMASIALPIRALNTIGCDTLILTNAAGSLRKTMIPGSLMMITDHINWAGVNPQVGPNDDTLGARFFDMTRAYDPDLRARLREAAAAANIDIFEGIYLMYPGPNFETPAEIRAFAMLGADATGMSTVPECLVANHCGMRVVAVSVITNLAAGIAPQPLTHAETLSTGALATGRLFRLLQHFLQRIF